MKIAIIGSQGVGKTTLAEMLSKELGIEVLPEVAREMIKEGYTLDNGATEDFERALLYRQLGLENRDDFIADRGVIDILAYCIVLFKDNYLLLNEINNWLAEAKYDIIFYLPIEFPIEDDGVRSTDVEFQKQIDEAVLAILEVGLFKWCKLTGGREKRLKQALKYLTSKK